MRNVFAFVKTSGATSRVARAGCVLALAAASLAGCSDDIVCSEEVPPFVSALVTEISDGRGGGTLVEVYCSGDPLPEIFAVAVNDRQLPEPVPAPDRPGFVTVLSDTAIVWQPGTSCVLSLAHTDGIASALETVPGPFEVAAPGTVSAGGVAAITWTESDDADYYVLEATMESARRGTTETVTVVEGTSFDVDLASMPGDGFVSGSVSAVSGPLPLAGSAGNVSGEGRGFMNISYRGSESLFQIVVTDSGSSRRPRHP